MQFATRAHRLSRHWLTQIVDHHDTKTGKESPPKLMRAKHVYEGEHRVGISLRQDS